MGMFALNPITGRLDETGNSGGGGTGDAFTSIFKQVFDTEGENTYIPTPGMVYCIVQGQASGGGGGGAVDNQTACGGGGGGGGYFMGLFTADEIGENQPLTIGAAGLGGTPGNAGGDGGDLFFGAGGSLGIAEGGKGGDGGTLPVALVKGGDGGSADCTNKIFCKNGSPGSCGLYFNSNIAGGLGGDGHLGSGANISGINDSFEQSIDGNTPQQGHGGGGSGASSNYTIGGAVGGDSSLGCLIVIEYLQAI